MDYSTEGGYTDSCSANMSNGRGPFRLEMNSLTVYFLSVKFEIGVLTFDG